LVNGGVPDISATIPSSVKVNTELFERIRFVDKHSGGLDNSNIRIELL